MMYTDGIASQERASLSMYKVYGWMAGALSLTAAVAYYIGMTPHIFKAVFGNPLYLGAIVVLQLGIVMAISFLLNRMSFVTAALLFAVYAVSVGVTMSAIFYAYQHSSIYATFAITAAMFGAMAIYGYVTRADLTSIGSIGLMVLVGMIIASVVNIFLKSSGFAFFISAVGVVLFSLLTAYDVQKIKELSQRFLYDRETSQKIALFGALTLYLDFINLFLSLLQFMGKQREN